MTKKEDKKEKTPKTDHKELRIKELTETLQRLQAEFENYKKRIDKEFSERIKYSNAGLISKLLPVLDSFELAIKNKDKSEDFIKGMELVYSQFYSVLKEEGLKPIEALNKKFDPYLHEVMMQEENDKEDEIILEEFQKGYMLNDRVLRHSKVKVSKKREQPKEVKQDVKVEKNYRQN
jgi:molecular chaperone GrpE